MKLSVTFLLAFALSGGIAVAQQSQPPQPSSQQQNSGGKAIVHVRANMMEPVDVADSTAIVNVGNVVAYHDGAVITCDSLIQYNSLHVECFGNVILNKDSTYVYGDRVDYDGEVNIAQVFSPLVKMIDGDAVLYTYNFLFNTQDNVGEYYGGGTMARDETLLESDRGFYYADTKDVICVGDVELRDSTYQIISDSLGYNMNSEVATLYSKSYIWNEKGEILSADKGWYYTKEERYRFISNAYVLTEKQEIWADDIDYRAEMEDIIMRRNIQIRDEEQKTLGFGDYGLYFGRSGNAMLTEMPSVINFEEADSLYLRADSIFMYVLDSTSVYSSEYAGNKKVETTAADGSLVGEETLISSSGLGSALQVEQNALARAIQTAAGEALAPEGGVGEIPDSMISDSTAVAGVDAAAMQSDGAPPESEGEQPPSGELSATTDTGKSTEAGDDAAIAPDGLDDVETTGDDVAVPAPDTPKTKAELRAEKRAEKERARAERQAAKEQRRREKEAERNPATTAEAQSGEDFGDGSAKTSSGENTDGGTEGAATEGETVTPEGEAGASDGGEATEATETADTEVVAEGEEGGPSEEGVSEDEEPAGEKERERVVVGYHKVRIYRSDFQAVCDSLIGFSIDSTIHMHIKPIMWNEDNQITSDLAVIHTKNEKLDKAVFTGGNPVMASQLDTVKYNQVTGREITAFFADNEIYRVDANGNGKTYYYMQDEETGETQEFSIVECSDITFHIKERAMERIVWNGNPVFSIYPMGMIPDTQERIMPNFEWQGSLRPAKRDVFDRVVRPSEREFYVGLRQPQFPLTDSIHNYRKELIRGGIWHDRTDDISPLARDFIWNIQSGKIVL